MAHPFSAEALFSLKGQVAVVTGGGTGIGLMGAKALAANGAKVYITGRRQEKLDEAVKNTDVGSAGGSLHAIPMDVTNKESIQAAVEKIKEQEKFISILINNAGIAKGTKRALGESKSQGVEAYAKIMSEYDEDAWADTYKTNVSSVWYVTAAFLPLLSKAKAAQSPKEGGSIINITSISGITYTSQQGQEIYNSSKRALMSLTDLMATELIAPEIGVRVNSIAPGLFPSEMTVRFPSPEDREAHLKNGIPMGRPGLASEMAQTVLFVAANHYLHGQHVTVDGGWLLTHR